MSETPDIPLEEVKDSAVKFDLANLRLELDGMLEKLKGDSEALSQLHEMLSNALRNCEQAMTDADYPDKSESRRIPHD